MKKVLFICCLLFLTPVGATTLNARQLYIPPIPENIDNTDFYLLTAGLGDDFYTRFGHTVLRIIDRDAGADYNYNWGMFDFDDPGFGWKFFRGVLMYRMGLSTFQQTMATYRDWEKRRVWQDKLELTRAQKVTLMKRIIWNSQPENIYFPYQYFFNNCSTKVRDYLDEALAGKISSAFKDAPAEPRVVYRDYVRRNLGVNPIIGVSLDVLMNADIVRVMTKWDEMFLPGKLREHLLTLEAYSDEGLENPTKKFLTSDSVLVDLPDKGVDSREARGGFLWLMVLGLIPFYPTFKHLISKQYSLLPMSVVAVRCLGFGVLSWGLLSAVFGTVMVVSWIFSTHTDLHHNANLWLFWPLDWLFVIAGFSLLKKGQGLNLTRPLWKLTRTVALAHIIAAAVFLALFASGFLKQNVSYILLYIAPSVAMVSALLAMPKLHSSIATKGIINEG